MDIEEIKSENEHYKTCNNVLKNQLKSKDKELKKYKVLNKKLEGKIETLDNALDIVIKERDSLK